MADTPWREAVIAVLTKAGQAIHYKVIAEEIEELGLRKNLGATPANTVSVVLNESIRKDGDDGPFIRTNPGFYMLKGQVATTNDKDGIEPVTSEPELGDQIVKCVGMYWKLDSVNWKAKPRLLGQQQQGSKEVDFCEQLGVYLLYDRARVIYVGRSVDRPLGTRLFEHTKDRLNGRWDRFSWLGLRGVDDTGKLTDASFKVDQSTIISLIEAILIESLEPPQNRKRGDDFSEIEYLQVPDKEKQNKSVEAMLALLKVGMQAE